MMNNHKEGSEETPDSQDWLISAESSDSLTTVTCNVSLHHLQVRETGRGITRGKKIPDDTMGQDQYMMCPHTS